MLDADFVVARRSFEVIARLGLARGERLSLFGPSGSGKTTCLEAIAGSVELKHGQIRLDGRLVNAARERRIQAPAKRPIEPRERGVALVRQPTTLFPHLNVRENVTYRVRKRALFGDRSLEQLLDEVGLGGLAGASPDALSGGQRQRACLARAIAQPFRALLLDEPFSAVDSASRVMLRNLAIDACDRAGAVGILVTHDLGEAQAFGHQLGIIDEGQMLQVGSTDELVRRPGTVRVAQLCGFSSFVPHDSETLWALHPDRFVEGARPDLGIVLAGRVRSVQAFGPRFTCEMVPLTGALEHSTPADGTNALSGDGGFSGEAAVRVHVESPPRVGDQWEVTALHPPLVKRVPSPALREGGSSGEDPSTFGGPPASVLGLAEAVSSDASRVL
jgi:ABC-type Fe3+/spermidine/putrescine transport system ATPase subunit